MAKKAQTKKAAPAPKKKEAPKARSLSRGMTGEDVKKLQTALGIEATGTFDIGTKGAVVSWQKANGMAADGIAGPDMLAKL